MVAHNNINAVTGDIRAAVHASGQPPRSRLWWFRVLDDDSVLGSAPYFWCSGPFSDVTSRDPTVWSDGLAWHAVRAQTFEAAQQYAAWFLRETLADGFSCRVVFYEAMPADGSGFLSTYGRVTATLHLNPQR